jgi:hypothetical protein
MQSNPRPAQPAEIVLVDDFSALLLLLQQLQLDAKQQATKQSAL